MAKTPSILDRLILLLTPLRVAGEHEGYLRNLAAAVGWDLDEIVGFDAATAAADLRMISEGIEISLNMWVTLRRRSRNSSPPWRIRAEPLRPSVALAGYSATPIPLTSMILPKRSSKPW